MRHRLVRRIVWLHALHVRVHDDHHRSVRAVMSHMEALAILWRGATGFVPPGIFYALWPEERERLEGMSQTRALKIFPDRMASERTRG